MNWRGTLHILRHEREKTLDRMHLQHPSRVLIPVAHCLQLTTALHERSGVLDSARCRDSHGETRELPLSLRTYRVDAVVLHQTLNTHPLRT